MVLSTDTHLKFLALAVGRIIVLRIATAGGFLAGGRGTHFLAMSWVGWSPRLTILGDRALRYASRVAIPSNLLPSIRSPAHVQDFFFFLFFSIAQGGWNSVLTSWTDGRWRIDRSVELSG